MTPGSATMPSFSFRAVTAPSERCGSSPILMSGLLLLLGLPMVGRTQPLSEPAAFEPVVRYEATARVAYHDNLYRVAYQSGPRQGTALRVLPGLTFQR